MKKKYTPGPWIAVRQNVIGPSRNHWVIDGDSPHIPGMKQTICDINGPWAESNYMANANLIAAAPELLAACELLMRAEDMQKGARGGCVMGEISQAIDAAREAIKKAKGIQ